jgi:hypothetical protein
MATETTGTMVVPTMTTIAPSPPTTTTTMATGTKTLTTSMEAVDGSELCHYPPLTPSCWSRGSSCCAVTVSPSSPPSPRRPHARGAGGCALRSLS